MWAFRYALGRRTGAVDDVVVHLLKFWGKLTPYTRNQIKREIDQAIKEDRAGDKCDVQNWEKLLLI
jgi:hypothetical protein